MNLFGTHTGTMTGKSRPITVTELLASIEAMYEPMTKPEIHWSMYIDYDVCYRLNLGKLGIGYISYIIGYLPVDESHPAWK